MRLLASIALAACAAAPPPLPPKNVAAPVGVGGMPALFAPLFRTGATWTFPAEIIDGHYEMSGPVRTVEKGEVTCTVEEARPIKDGWVASVGCDGAKHANLSRGTYVATAAGLWLADDFGDDITKLDPKQMLIAATPKAGDRTTQDGESGDTWKVTQHGDGWCFGHFSWGGDEGGWLLCIAAGKGVIGGYGFFAGGATQDTYFGDSPRY